MALREARLACSRALRPSASICRPFSSTSTAATTSSLSGLDLLEQQLEQSSLRVPAPSSDAIKSFDPLAQAKKRRYQLPPSRYNFRPPKYYRGPLHPHQPPPPTDIASREFIPGPFTLSRLEQTYQSTFAPDLLALTYQHVIPGTEKPPLPPRERPWVGDSPYFENRTPRGPRGSSVLRPLRRPINFRTIPQLTGVSVQTHMRQAAVESSFLHAGGMVIQAITNVRVEALKSKKAVAEWGAKKDKWVAVKAELKGEDMYHFLSKVVELVMPRIKDWKGISNKSGDTTGNITFGFTPEQVALFPEIEVNYESYPPHMIPGCHVTIHTSAVTDRDARLLLSSIGIPFTARK